MEIQEQDVKDSDDATLHAQGVAETPSVSADAQEAAETPSVDADAQEAAETPSVDADAQEAAETPSVSADAQEAAETPSVSADAQEVAETPSVSADAQEVAETPSAYNSTQDISEILPLHRDARQVGVSENTSVDSEHKFNSFEKVYKIHDNDRYSRVKNNEGSERRGEFFKDRDLARTNKFKKFDKIEVKKLVIDYKKPEILQEFLTEKGRILSRLITGNSAQNQRKLTREVKRARYIGFLPNA